MAGDKAFFQAISGKVEGGVIRGVSVVTMGEAIGHNLWIDRNSLTQFESLGKAFPNGVKVKSKHGTNFDAIVGALKEFRIEGEKLLADLHLIEAHPQYGHILELAEKLPGEFGLSAAFNYTKEKVGSITAIRPTELDSVDIVDAPAANPDGLFSQVDTTASGMDQKTEDKSLTEIVKGFFSKAFVPSETLSAVQTEVTTYKAQLEAKNGELSAALEKITKLESDHKSALAAKDAEVETKAAAKALEIAASQGIQLGKVKADKATDNSDSGNLTKQCLKANGKL